MKGESQSPEPITPGAHPPELLALCRRAGVRPADLLGWALRPDGVTIILPNGIKVSATIRGAWGKQAARAQKRAAPKTGGAARTAATAGGAERVTAAEARA